MVPSATPPLTEGANFQEQLNQHKKGIKENQDNHKEVKPGTVEGHLHATTPATGDRTGSRQCLLTLRAVLKGTVPSGSHKNYPRSYIHMYVCIKLALYICINSSVLLYTHVCIVDKSQQHDRKSRTTH